MKLSHAFIACIFLLTACSADKQAELETAIPYAIELLESKQYEEFLNTFIAPSMREQVLEGTTLEEKATEIQYGASFIIQPLKSIIEKEPEIKDNRATYELSDDFLMSQVIFIKEDGKWYLEK